MAMNNTKFIEFVKGLENDNMQALSEALAFAARKAVQKRPDFNWIDALISAAYRSVWRQALGQALRAAGVLEHAKIDERDSSITFKGIEVTHQIRPKKGREFEFSAALASIDAGTLADEVEKAEAEKAEKAKEKRKATEERKKTAGYWIDRLNKLKAEAEKFGFEVKGHVIDGAEYEESEALDAEIKALLAEEKASKAA